MLQTINGFDLFLIFTIVVMWFRICHLNEECESYVRQIIEVSQDNYQLNQLQLAKLDDDYLDSLLEPIRPRTDLSCQWTSECACKDCVPF
jgi:hypothetical protein